MRPHVDRGGRPFVGREQPSIGLGNWKLLEGIRREELRQAGGGDPLYRVQGSEPDPGKELQVLREELAVLTPVLLMEGKSSSHQERLC